MRVSDINKYLFSKTAPLTKIKTINSLSKEELLSVTQETLRRIVSEVGYSSKPHSHSRELRISSDNRVGNNWNSQLEAIGYCGKEMYVYLYVQYSNTDITIGEDCAHFFRKGDYRGTVTYTDRYDAPQSQNFYYDTDDKALCMRSILIEYINRKYADKLDNTI